MRLSMQQGIKKLRLNHQGFSLVEMLVAVGIMGGVVTQINFSMTSQIKMSKKVEYDMDVEAMRLSLLTRIDCEKTCGLDGQGCLAGPVVLRDRGNNPINTNFGRWIVSPVSGNGGILATARNVVNGQTAKDPITEKLLENIPVIDPSFNLCGKSRPTSTEVKCKDQDTVIVGFDFSKATPEAICKKVESQNIDTEESKRLERAHLKDLSVVGGKISTANNANKLSFDRLGLNAAALGKFGSNSVTPAKVAGGTVTNIDFALSSISESKIVDYNINGSHLQANIVKSSNISTNAIETRHFQDGAVTSAKIKSSSVGNDQILVDAITTDKIENGTFGANDIGANIITRNHIRNDAINSPNLVGSDISAYKIAISQIIGNKIDNNSVTTSKIIDWTISGQQKIVDENITLAKLTPCLEGEFYVYQDDTNGGWKCEDPTSNIEIARATLVLRTDLDGNGLEPTIENASPAGIWTVHKSVNLASFPGSIGKSHGIQCGDPSINDTNHDKYGWAMISCIPTDNQSFSDAAPHVLQNPAARNTMFIDRDTYIEGTMTGDVNKKDATCWTNDFEQVRDAKAINWVDGPIVKDYRMDLHVICIRYKKN